MRLTVHASSYSASANDGCMFPADRKKTQPTQPYLAILPNGVAKRDHGRVSIKFHIEFNSTRAKRSSLCFQRQQNLVGHRKFQQTRHWPGVVANLASDHPQTGILT